MDLKKDLEKGRDIAFSKYEKYLTLYSKGLITETTLRGVTDDLLEVFGIKKTLRNNDNSPFDSKSIKATGIVALAEMKEDGFFDISYEFGNTMPNILKVHKGTIVGLKEHIDLTVIPKDDYSDAARISVYVKEGNVFYSVYLWKKCLQNIEKIN